MSVSDILVAQKVSCFNIQLLCTAVLVLNMLMHFANRANAPLAVSQHHCLILIVTLAQDDNKPQGSKTIV